MNFFFPYIVFAGGEANDHFGVAFQHVRPLVCVVCVPPEGDAAPTVHVPQADQGIRRSCNQHINESIDPAECT